MSLTERLHLEFEILERVSQIRETGDPAEVSEDVERAIIERELAELEKQMQGEEVLVRRRKRAD